MMWNLQSHPTPFSSERMWHFRGKYILWPLLHIYKGVRQSYPMTVLNERMCHFRGANILWPLLHIFRGQTSDTLHDPVLWWVQMMRVWCVPVGGMCVCVLVLVWQHWTVAWISRKIGITFHLWHKSFILRHVKLADLSNNSVWMKECDILGGQYILWPAYIFTRGLWPQPLYHLRPWCWYDQAGDVRMMCVIGWYVCVLVTVSRSEHWRISVVEYKRSESNTSSHQSVSGASNNRFTFYFGHVFHPSWWEICTVIQQQFRMKEWYFRGSKHTLTPSYIFSRDG